MTNKEAVKEIEKWPDGCPFEDTKEAFTLAINALKERPQASNNAELFKQTFGLYATEVWAMKEADFLKWLNADMRGGDQA